MCQELGVREVFVPGDWPWAGDAERSALAGALLGVPDGSAVFVDGLVACAAPEVVVPAAARLRLAVLVHLPLADETGLTPGEAAELDARERATLRAAAAVVATSATTARRLVEHHGLAPARVHVAAPGADRASLASGTPDGRRLLCVAALTPRKGHDVLVAALAKVAEWPWECLCAGAGDPDRLDRLVAAHGLDGRVRFEGAQVGADLDARYAAADLLVLASHAETYGMVVTEALARGVPVLATAVGGVPEALGHAPSGAVPGLLVPPGDVAALAGALRRWLGEPDTRERLRAAARARRETLTGWDVTARAVTDVVGMI
nr:glycosyltransferase family 4 protein [Phytohabitans rumicis]